MKKILCFGDSNTYGYNPLNGERFQENERWTGIFKQLCKSDFEVVEDGCNNRKCFSELAINNMNGYNAINKHLNNKYDLIILQIGINDLHKIYSNDKLQIEQGFEKFIKQIKDKSSESKILILSPSKIKKNILNSSFSSLFDENSIIKSYWIKDIYKSLADKYGCFFIDLNMETDVSDIDGLHYTKDEHKKIANLVYNFVIQNVQI